VPFVLYSARITTKLMFYGVYGSGNFFEVSDYLNNTKGTKGTKDEI